MEFTKKQLEIINAAKELIGAKGVQSLTTKKLANKMAFSEPALYRHFKSKTEILKSVLIYYKGILKDGIDQIILSECSANEKIKKIIKFQFQHFSKNPAVIMVIFSETSLQYDEGLSKQVLKIIEQKNNLVEGIIKDGQKEQTIRNDISAQSLVTLILGTMRFTVLKWKLSNFDTDLIEEGKELCKTIELLIKK